MDIEWKPTKIQEYESMKKKSMESDGNEDSSEEFNFARSENENPDVLEN